MSNEHVFDEYEVKAVYWLSDHMRRPLETQYRELLWLKKEERTNEELFRLMWRFKAEHPYMDRKEVLEAFYKEYGIKEQPVNDCYACEECMAGCASCPLVLGGMSECCTDASLYMIEKAFRTRDDEDFESSDAAICKQIYELPWGEQK